MLRLERFYPTPARAGAAQRIALLQCNSKGSTYNKAAAALLCPAISRVRRNSSLRTLSASERNSAHHTAHGRRHRGELDGQTAWRYVTPGSSRCLSRSPSCCPQAAFKRHLGSESIGHDGERRAVRVSTRFPLSAIPSSTGLRRGDFSRTLYSSSASHTNVPATRSLRLARPAFTDTPLGYGS